MNENLQKKLYNRINATINVYITIYQLITNIYLLMSLAFLNYSDCETEITFWSQQCVKVGLFSGLSVL